MARISHQYRHHKSSGRAFVSFDGKRVYLGKYGTEESKNAYRTALLEYQTTGKVSPQSASAASVGLTINEMLVPFVEHVHSYYRHPDGRQTGEVHNIKRAIRILKDKFGSIPAATFGPDELETCREEMIRLGWCRTSCNANTYRIRRAFKWAARKRMIPASVFAELSIVEGLAPYRSPAPEREPIKPIADDVVDACLPHMPRAVAAMVQLQRLTGMRPGEVIEMKGENITMQGDVWTDSPPLHKNTWRGRNRTVYLGPKAQEVIRPFLVTDLSAHLFDASLEQELPKKRRRLGLKQESNSYSVHSYRRAITRACHRAKVPVWGPNRLRHSHATEVRQRFGLEAASVVLGHAKCRGEHRESYRSHAIDWLA
ncbi:site-specific integrase [bacterium]|nr:site-specific integrase [bacterium]